MRSSWIESKPVHRPASSNPSLESIRPSDETTDTEDNEEDELGVMEDQRSVILHLLSQLKLGMDLTRVVLPTFILEKRSLLEMYANFMAHPDLFLCITAAVTPEERIVRFVEYYLTSFHEGRKGAVAKKPYNPVLGESFHCSWEVPRDRVRPPQRTNAGPGLRDPARTEPSGADTSGCYRVRFVAEQVSHHPPVSGFYCECQERRMCVNAHVWTKSKFMGMSIGVSMVGEGVLCLLEHDEEYVFTLPCAYARSILTVPWVELGGKVSINCAKSGYSATVTFHTKPFYGGKVHSSGETKVIDTSKLPVIKKKIRPLERQGLMESRRLWQRVTEALKEGNVDAATEHKHILEERQRSEERQRATSNTPWKPKHFIKESPAFDGQGTGKERRGHARGGVPRGWVLSLSFGTLNRRLKPVTGGQTLPRILSTRVILLRLLLVSVTLEEQLSKPALSVESYEEELFKDNDSPTANTTHSAGN
ncbi:hypothetical protein JZ751_009663, partial [Albula glossodonta]